MTPEYDFSGFEGADGHRLPILQKLHFVVSDDPIADHPKAMGGLSYWSKLVAELEPLYLAFDTINMDVPE